MTPEPIIPNPASKIYMDRFDTDYWWVIQKICEVLFTDKYNAFCVNTARSILDFLVKARFLTGKQIILIYNLSPSRK